MAKLKHQQDMAKCWERGIYVVAEAVNSKAKTKVNLIVINGKTKTYSKQQYEQNKVHLKIYELYATIAAQF